jgi:hypothetical protein
MIKRHTTIVLLIAVVISAAILITTFSKKAAQPTIRYTAKIFEGCCGWGYDILANDTVLIRQESIPVISNTRGFTQKQQAEKAAALVLTKIKNGGMPSLTKEELARIIPALANLSNE